MSNVAPMAVPEGKHAAGTPSKNRVPRRPLGPSERRIERIPSREMSVVCQVVCQKSFPIECISTVFKYWSLSSHHTSCESNFLLQS